ncbi:pyridoxamine 5'-phosphate oxidase [Terriglobus aquaticus]|uniref:Pyridoxamine 5'-phosphate oxidase n=1 Tax=Terriglobus aquaticus TaxID=940139 RepID=A0ABW9KGD3_9BACT|nr:pyridoxamine 5'-phosphate oxidase [Terriglobus aquaticus]
MDLFANLPNEPMPMFREWLTVAETSEPNDANAAALATATRDGLPSVRMVLVKGAEDRGLSIFTDRDSQKGREIAGNPEVALCLHWKSQRRQVRFAGRMEPLSREESERYFHSRSRGSQIAAAVSHQSEPLASRAELDTAVKQYEQELGGAEVPLPERWVGFLLVPRRVEFWSDGKDRLHDRVVFLRDGDGWKTERLYP